MPYEIQGAHIAGFDLYGTKNDDGTFTIGHSEPKVTLPEFPAEVELLGVTYGLEYVKWNAYLDDPHGAEQPWAKDAPPDDPRRRICWGIYC